MPAQPLQLVLAAAVRALAGRGATPLLPYATVGQWRAAHRGGPLSGARASAVSRTCVALGELLDSASMPSGTWPT
jgi:hypothetical protein